MSWTLKTKLAQKRSRTGRWCWAIETELVFCFSCFPTAELFLHSSWDSSCVVLWSLRNAGRTDTALINILLF